MPVHLQEYSAENPTAALPETTDDEDMVVKELTRLINSHLALLRGFESMRLLPLRFGHRETLGLRDEPAMFLLSDIALSLATQSNVDNEEDGA